MIKVDDAYSIVKKEILDKENVKLFDISYCDKRNAYIFTFEYSNGNQYDNVALINENVGHLEKKHFTTMMIEDSKLDIKKEDYKKIDLTSIVMNS